MRKSRYKLVAGDPGYGADCPDCGRPKRRDAKRCLTCRKAHADHGVHTTGRSESIITFRNTESATVRTLQCFGDSAKAQVANGLARLADDDGSSEDRVVECRSTPRSILQDLRGSSDPKDNYRRVNMLKRAVS